MATRASKLMWLVVPALAALAGCPPQDAQLAPRTNWYVQDIPVPAGFERNQQESNYSSDTAGRRILDVYEGQAHPIRVRNFYLTQMPSAGWARESDSLAGGVYTLVFSKAQESATITIGVKPDRRWNTPTEARINIESRGADPQGRDAAPNEENPKPRRRS